MRRAIFLAVPIAILLGACGEKAAPPKPPIPEVVVITLQPRTLPVVFEQPGQTAGFREVEVRSRVGGILLKRHYQEGQPVKEGQVLFTIDPEPYRASLDQARGQLRQAEATLERAKADRDRIVPLFRENAVSRKDFDDANANYDNAVASVDSAKGKVREAELNVGYTNVTAPISGVASKETKSEGSLVTTAGDASLLTTISQLDPMYVNFSFAENEKLDYDSAVRAGRIVPPANRRVETKIRLADGSEFEGKGFVDFADTRVDTKTGTIRARAEFPNPKAMLLPGQFVRILVGVGEARNVLAVPERAITQAQATRMVLVVNDKNVIEARPVTLGAKVAGEVSLLTGVKAGERVVVDGLMKARPGSEVKPVAPGTPPTLPPGMAPPGKGPGGPPAASPKK